MPTKEQQAQIDNNREQLSAVARHLFTVRKESVTDTITGLELVARKLDRDQTQDQHARRDSVEDVLSDVIQGEAQDQLPDETQPVQERTVRNTRGQNQQQQY